MTTNIVFTLIGVLFFTAAVKAQDCSLCEYHNGIGFIADENLCGVYYMCTRNPYDPDNYHYTLLCCEYGLKWDSVMLTCEFDPDRDCEEPQPGFCPIVATTSEGATPAPCHYSAYPEDNQYFIFPRTGEVGKCGEGKVFEEHYCACVYEEGFIPVAVSTCPMLLNFNFNILDDFSSVTCNNFANGDPTGEIFVEDGVLCMEGDGFMSIGFLNNWFVLNPSGQEISMCMWIFPASPDQDSGILSTNCNWQTEGSVAELFLVGGSLKVVLGSATSFDTGIVLPAGDWSLVCITFKDGVYALYVDDGVAVDLSGLPALLPGPINSQTPTTIGYVKTSPNLFEGYIDDFRFWTLARNAADVASLFSANPTNSFHPTP